MAPQGSTINCLILAHQRHFWTKKKYSSMVKGLKKVVKIEKSEEM
jgi:hypothetical protein